MGKGNETKDAIGAKVRIRVRVCLVLGDMVTVPDPKVCKGTKVELYCRAVRLPKWGILGYNGEHGDSGE